MSKLSKIRQKELIDRSINKKIHLKEILKENKYSYDDLVYYSNGVKLEETPYFCLDDLTKKKFHIPCISFFSGAGGFDIGFSYAGFETKAFFEYNELFCNTLLQSSTKPKQVVHSSFCLTKNKISSLKNYFKSNK